LHWVVGTTVYGGANKLQGKKKQWWSAPQAAYIFRYNLPQLNPSGGYLENKVKERLVKWIQLRLSAAVAVGIVAANIWVTFFICFWLPSPDGSPCYTQLMVIQKAA